MPHLDKQTSLGESATSGKRRWKRPLFSARKLALMASVVTGLCLAGNGFSSSPGSSIVGTAAHAEASNAVSSVAPPTGFAELVDRVKPSVISVKVTMKEKAVDADSKTEDGSDSPMERLRLAARCPREPILCSDRFHQSANAQNAHYSFHVVGQDVQRHFGTDML
jgi:hypothetical protein